jgi:hypothetical protein
VTSDQTFGTSNAAALTRELSPTCHHNFIRRLAKSRR